MTRMTSTARASLPDAACLNRNPRLWETDKIRTRANVEAIRICNTECPTATRIQCLAHALADEEGYAASNRYNIHGGLMPQERAALAKGGAV